MTEDRIMLVNKPVGWTSFDVVKYIRNRMGGVKIGHAGTLDPLAEGLLILCTGKMTKKIPEIQDAEKEYTGTLVLGAETDSFDLETPVKETHNLSGITPQQIVGAAKQFVGEILQTPPHHSAVKINGKRAYSLARKGKTFEITPKKVTIHEFEITGIELPEVAFRVVCSKGTYIRSLAYDLGRSLGCGAYLKSLRRTRVGIYHLEIAQIIETLNN